MRRTLAACALAGAIAGCGGGSGGIDSARTTTSTPATASAPTRTEVVKTIKRAGKEFDPEAIYKSRAPGVVTVFALSGRSGSNALGRQASAVGSGFVTDAAGYVATNAHVVTSGSGSREADDVYVEFGDGNRLAARVIGVDLNSDLALLKVDPGELRGPGAAIVPLPLGSTAGLQVGDPVAAIGSPFNEKQSLSVGVVSATNRDIESLTRFQIGNAIQTDAAINHGNSGGPLLNADGKVIGVNSQIRSTGGGGEGVGFAIPVETLERSLAQLRAKGRVDYAYVGITSVELYPQLAARLGVKAQSGAIVDEITRGSPADKAGLRAAREHITFQGRPGVPVGGDIILAIDGRRLDATTDVADAIGRHEPGDTVSFAVLRDGKRRTVRVTLAARPTTRPD